MIFRIDDHAILTFNKNTQPEYLPIRRHAKQYVKDNARGEFIKRRVSANAKPPTCT